MRSKYPLLFAVLLGFAGCKSWGKFWQTEIQYPSNPLLVTQNVAMTPVTPTIPGSASSCSVSPPLPDGLSLASDCTISGTPSRGQGALPYRVTADIGSGSVSGELRIRVLFQPRFVYAANVADNNVSGFTINPSTGALTPIGSYAADSGARFVLRDPSGRYLYVANRTGLKISAFSINQTTGVLTTIPGLFTTSALPYSLATDPEGKFLYVGHEDTGVAAISGYTIDGATGALTAISGSPFPAAIGASPASVNVSPDGKHLYAGSTQSGASPNSFGYSIDPQTGRLTPLAGSPFGALNNGVSVFVHPSGKYVYYAQYGTQTVGYNRDAASGALSLIADSPFATGAAPGFITGDVAGKFVLVANSGDAIGTSGLTGYAVAADGSLSTLSGFPITTGKNPIGIAFDETSRFVYVVGSGETNPAPDSVYAYALDGQTGALSPIGTFPAGVDTTGVTVAGSNP